MMAAMPGPFNEMNGCLIKDFTVTMNETGIPRYNITLLLQESDSQYSRQKVVEAIR